MGAGQMAVRAHGCIRADISSDPCCVEIHNLADLHAAIVAEDFGDTAEIRSQAVQTFEEKISFEKYSFQLEKLRDAGNTREETTYL